MRVLLSTLNARYTHSSLALAYLKEACYDEKWNLELREFTINDNLADLMAEIYRYHPSVICFSCYIWNIKEILQICNDYKSVDPDCIIILGGPEVSFNTRDFLMVNGAIDVIISGEGEFSLKEVLLSIFNKTDFASIEGITYRGDNEIIQNGDRDLIKDMSLIQSPYYGDMSYFDNKMVYYETSRGCPFNCSYCISSTFKGVRFFPMDRVKKDLKFLIQSGIKRVKFVDRTFNSNEKRALEIMQFILDQNGETSFHFEIYADLFSEDMITFLKDVPPGIFDFEIGVQSTCPEALRAVKRSCDWDKLLNNVKRIKSYNNIHLHLDLIAGLPYENYQRFGVSFNDVYSLEPDVIQLGFLKLLKGSELHRKKNKYGYRYQSLAPYQVLANSFIAYKDIIRLIDIEDMLDKYYNSGNMRFTFRFAVDNFEKGDAFKFLEEFSGYWREYGFFKKPHKRDDEYVILYRFTEERHPAYLNVVNELLKYDYLLSNLMHKVPVGLLRYNVENSSKLLTKILLDEKFINMYAPEMRGKTLREMKKYAHVEYLKINPSGKCMFEEAQPVLFLYDHVSKKINKSIHISSLLEEHEIY